MRAIARFRAVAREAVSSAVAAPVASLITVVMIAGMCAAVLLTSGRTVGAEQQVIDSIDTAGTRSIVVRADPDAGLDQSVIERVRTIRGVESVTAFGPATDAQNAALPGGTRVPLRHAWTDAWDAIGLPARIHEEGSSAFASPGALSGLGFAQSIGAVRTVGGDQYGVAGRPPAPDHLAFLEPVLISPQPPSRPGSVSILVVIAEQPQLVGAVAAAVGSVLAVDDPSKITVETSEDLATLRALIEGQLGSFGRGLTLGILALTALLAATILYGIVMLRRKEYGRRRALGASQRLIVVLMMMQSVMLASVGAALGSVAALIVLHTTGDPLPGMRYIGGLLVLAVAVSAVATVVPALVAARREPIAELRVP